MGQTRVNVPRRFHRGDPAVTMIACASVLKEMYYAFKLQAVQVLFSRCTCASYEAQVMGLSLTQFRVLPALDGLWTTGVRSSRSLTVLMIRLSLLP